MEGTSTHLDSVSEHSVCEKESVEEVDGEEPQVSQSLQQPLRCGVTDLRDFAVIESPGEPDVHVVLEQRRVTLDKLRHGAGGHVGQGDVVEVVEVDVVHTLRYVGYPGGLLLLGGSHQVQRPLLAGLDAVYLYLEVEAAVLRLARPAGAAEVTEAAGAAEAGAERGLLVCPLLVTGVLDEADLGQGDPAHPVHQVESAGVCPGGDEEVVAEEEALPDGLPLLLHHRQPPPGPRPRLLRENLHITTSSSFKAVVPCKCNLTCKRVPCLTKT